MRKLTEVKHELKAKTFNELQVLMVRNMMARGAFFDYEIQKPQYKGDSYTAYYYADIKDMIIEQTIEKAKNGSK